jgi:UDP-3-O-acyl-N-acetylglucosamine deacetylase
MPFWRAASTFPYGSDRTRNSIGREVTIGGCGLHTGEPCTLRLAPAGAGEGLVFYRDDLAPGLPIPATTAFVVATRNRIALGREGATVETVEHLLAVRAMAGISDCARHLTGPEVPAGDGSALPLLAAGRSGRSTGARGQLCPSGHSRRPSGSRSRTAS